MVQNQEDVYYYITLMNENYSHPALPKVRKKASSKACMHSANPRPKGPKVQLMGSGVILREVIAAAELLEKDWGVSADVWSVTSFTELRRRRHRRGTLEHVESGQESRESYVSKLLSKAEGPVIASTDYMRSFADQIRNFITQPYVTLGTDGLRPLGLARKLCAASLKWIATMWYWLH